MKLLNVVLLATLGIIIATSALAANVNVQLNGLRNSKGQVMVTVFNQTGFLKTPAIGANGKPIYFTIPTPNAAHFQVELDPGQYSIVVVHDENMNGKMDKSIIGAPSEGGSCTGKGMPSFSAPKWEDSNFTMGTLDLNFVLKMKYWL